MPPVTAPETAPSNIENQELSDRIRESLETTGDSSMRSLSARRSTLSTAASDISRDGLEIEYLFEGNLEDTSGNANHLAVSAGISFVTGQFGSAVSMPQDSYVLGYSSSTYDPGVMRTDYTMAFWFRTSNTSAGLFAVTK